MFHVSSFFFFFFFFNDTATTEIYTLSLHDALPIFGLPAVQFLFQRQESYQDFASRPKMEEHTSELQSPMYLVCRLLLEKKKKKKKEYLEEKTTQKYLNHQITLYQYIYTTT